ncbi:MAG: hypothetical protein M1837_000726 [Sclerophora amabilis]|nr:MAG: hypothetical protein M1837_000726 [Sclerophora amabilis]
MSSKSVKKHVMPCSSGKEAVNFTQQSAVPAHQPLPHDTQAPLPFARLTPANDHARQAFQKAILYMDEKSSHYHRQFVTLEPSSVLCDMSQVYSINSGSEHDTEESRGGRTPPERSPPDGHFKLSLDVLKDHLSWRIGKGSSKLSPETRGVDILLVSPRQREAKRMAKQHAFIYINIESGALMLEAGSDSSVYYWSENQEMKLAGSARTVLYQPTNHIRVGESEYRLTWEASDKDALVQARNEYLKDIHGRDPPHSKLDPLPEKNHRRIGHAIVHNSSGYGSFGWVSAGVESSTGQPLAIKQLQIRRDESSLRLAQDEVAVARLFMKVRAEHLPPLSLSNSNFVETPRHIEHCADLV